MVVQKIAQLTPETAAAVAAAGPEALDAAQAGRHLWTAFKAEACTVHVVHAVAINNAAADEHRVHVVLRLPEPVALLQLGVPMTGTTGTAVLLLVGASCRLWAFELAAPSSGCNPAPSTLIANSSNAALVPLGQPSCTAAHQLAAAVGWEHLCHCWESVTVQQRSCRGRRGNSIAVSPAASGTAALNLAKLHFSLQTVAEQQLARRDISQQQPAQLVHTVASWVCQPHGAYGDPAAAAAIPRDATSAATIILVHPDSGASAQPRLACSTRFVMAGEAAASTCGSPAGFLALATAADQLVLLPIGTPYVSSSTQQATFDNAAGANLPGIACFDGSRLWFCAAGAQAAAGSSLQPQELVLLAQSGRLVPADGLTGGPSVLLAAGGGGSRPSSPTASVAGRPCAATIRLVGVHAAAARGTKLCYLPHPVDGSSCSRLLCLDVSAGLSDAGTSTTEQLVYKGSMHGPLLLAALALPCSASSSNAEQMVLLTGTGALLATCWSIRSGASEQGDDDPGAAAHRQSGSSVQASHILIRLCC
jgi:hypothetical protein